MKEREGAASPTCTTTAAASQARAAASVGEQVQLFAPNHPSRLDQADEVSLVKPNFHFLLSESLELLGRTYYSLDRTLLPATRMRFW